MDEFVESLLIIVVLYNIPLEESESFLSIRKMDSGDGDLNLFVYDNSKQPQIIKAYDGLPISYVHDPKNAGVSKAYNKGTAHARKHQKKWVLLLDQDTSLPVTLLKSYWEATKQNPEPKLFVPILKLENGKIFSPCAYRFKRGFYLDTIKKGIHSLQKLTPVNSGMLIDVYAFFEVGGYNDLVKLDFSDFQFIERFRRRYSDFYVVDVECNQNFSDDEVSLASQANRFGYYCEGARNIEKDGLWAWLQYNTVVFLRAVRLGLRYKKLRFLGIYLNTFLFPKSTKA